MSLENYFKPFREQVIGFSQEIMTPYGAQPVIYADWTASGRLFAPIEQKLSYEFGPFIANTHSGSSTTGLLTTESYEYAREIVRRHIHADENDVILFCGFGMTAAVNKLQRLLGLKLHQRFGRFSGGERPVVFVTHMEHHSNHTSWLETVCDVVVLKPDKNHSVSPDSLREELERYANRAVKIGAFTAASNVTGIRVNHHTLAGLMHQYGGVCFVDFACSAPYTALDMHPESPDEYLDALYFSPHKFLGGPGSSGILAFRRDLYHNTAPDVVGGGTVTWTNPWGQYQYVSDIQTREDGGTPGCLQAVKAALSLRLKEQMGIERIAQREHELLTLFFHSVENIPGLHILEAEQKDRLPVISFYLEHVHYSLVVKLLNDRFGIQSRGGCSCAGTYGHYLLDIGKKQSRNITNQVDLGNYYVKPGWVRISFHPVMTDREVSLIADGIRQIALHYERWEKDYYYNRNVKEYVSYSERRYMPEIESLFQFF